MEETNRSEVQEEERGVTLGAIFRTIFRLKSTLILIAISLVVALAAGLFVQFYVDPKTSRYEAHFTFHIVRMGSSSDRFSSGYFFTEAETLEAVKAMDESFAEVDTENMLPGGSSPIQVTMETALNEDELLESYYLVSVNKSLFPNSKVAGDFVRRLIEYIKDKAVNDTIDLANKNDGFNGYQAILRTFNSAQTYEEKLSILVSQRNFITSLYDGWIATYGNLYNLLENNLSLMDMREIAQSVFSDATYGELASELSANAYLPSGEDNIVTLQMRRNIYSEQLDLNRKKLESLNSELSSLLEQYKGLGGSSATLTPELGVFHSRIAALAEENVDLEKKIEILDMRLGNLPGSEEKNKEYEERQQRFSESLDKVYSVLVTQAEQITSVAEEISRRESFTTILEAGEEGGVSGLLVAAVAFVLAFVVAGAVCYHLVTRREKEEKKPSAPSDPPAEQ